MNIKKEVKALIAAVKVLLGKKEFEKDLDAMFHNLLYNGLPELDKEPFYFYTYDLYSSSEQIPVDKALGVVYLYVQDGKLHYELLSKKNTDILYSGTLEIGAMDSKLLEDCSFVKLPPSSGENSREIFYQRDADGSKLVYIVSDDSKAVKVGFLATAPEDPTESIQEKLLTEMVEKRFCAKKEVWLNPIKDSLNAQLIEVNHFEPSYEKPFSSEDERAFTVMKVNKEIIEQEQKLLLFLEEMKAILSNVDFIKIFYGNKRIARLIDIMGELINTLILSQIEIIGKLLGANDTDTVINKISAAYGDSASLSLYSNLMSHIVILNKIMAFPHYKEAVSSFANINVKAKIKSGEYKQRDGDYKTIIETLERTDTPEFFLDQKTLSTRFTQLLLRRKMPLTDNFPKLFREGHAKFHELESVFLAMNRSAAATNRAEVGYLENLARIGDANAKAKEEIEARINEAQDPIHIISFDLLTLIWTINYLDTRPCARTSNDAETINIEHKFSSYKKRLKMILKKMELHFKRTDLILTPDFPNGSSFVSGKVYLKKLVDGKVKYGFKTTDGAVIIKVLPEQKINGDVITEDERFAILNEIQAQNKDFHTGIIIDGNDAIVLRSTAASRIIDAARTIDELPKIIESITGLIVTIKSEMYPHEKEEASVKAQSSQSDEDLSKDEQSGEGSEPAEEWFTLEEERRLPEEIEPSEKEPSSEEELSPTEERGSLKEELSIEEEPSSSIEKEQEDKESSAIEEKDPSLNRTFKESTSTKEEIIARRDTMYQEIPQGFFGSRKQLNLEVVIPLCEEGDATTLFALAKAAYTGNQGVPKDFRSAYCLAALAEEIGKTKESKKVIGAFIKKLSNSPSECDVNFPKINNKTPQELYLTYLREKKSQYSINPPIK